MVQGYWTLKDIGKRFRRSDRTINRWMENKTNPFPKPRIKGCPNLWAIDDAVSLLIDAGYQVIAPDPFRKLDR